MNEKGMLCEKAVMHFKKGYNCAQSILLTMFEYWYGNNDLIPKIATGFGGGIGRCGSVCGALTGGLMAIGVKYGTNKPSLEERLEPYKLAQQLYKRFEQKHGSVLCRELIESDLSDLTNLKETKNAKILDEKCLDFIRTTIEILLDLEESLD